MNHFEHLVPNLDLFAMRKPAVWLKTANRRKTEHAALLRHPVNPELVLDLRPFDRQAELFGEVCDCTGMVNVAMSDENLLQNQTFPLDHAENQRQVATRVDHCSAARLFAPQHRGILLKRGNRNDCVFHGRR